MEDHRLEQFLSEEVPNEDQLDDEFHEDLDIQIDRQPSFPMDLDDDNDNGDNDDDDDVEEEVAEDEDEDIVLLMAAYHFLQMAQQHIGNRKKIRVNPLVPMARLNIDAYDDATCEAMFRFRADEIRDIVVALRLPDTFILDNNNNNNNNNNNDGSKVLALEALCLVLRRLAYPCQFVELVQMFGRPIGMLSRITTCVLKWIHQRWARLLLEWDYARLQPAKLEEFAEAIHDAGAPLPGVVGFIDGAVRSIPRPLEGQEMEYIGNRHRARAPKYQAVASPDGIVIHLSGPYPTRLDDAAIYRASDLEDTLYRWAKNESGEQLYLYGGDPGYVISPVLQVPYPTPGITPSQQKFNEKMSAVRRSVEWTFGHVSQLFAVADFKNSQRSLLSRVHLHYTVSVIFANIHSCITETNSSVEHFGVIPPTLEEYLHD